MQWLITAKRQDFVTFNAFGFTWIVVYFPKVLQDWVFLPFFLVTLYNYEQP